MNIQIGDLVKFSGIVTHQYGVQFGTVIESDDTTESGNFKVMMYNAGLGQFTEWIHQSLLERVTPVDKI